MSSRNSVAGQSTAAVSMTSMQVNYSSTDVDPRDFFRAPQSLRSADADSRDRVDLRDSLRDSSSYTPTGTR